MNVGKAFYEPLVIGSANTNEHSVKTKVDLFEAKANDDASPQKPVVPNVEEELAPTAKPENNQGVY